MTATRASVAHAASGTRLGGAFEWDEFSKRGQVLVCLRSSFLLLRKKKPGSARHEAINSQTDTYFSYSRCRIGDKSVEMGLGCCFASNFRVAGHPGVTGKLAFG